MRLPLASSKSSAVAKVLLQSVPCWTSRTDQVPAVWFRRYPSQRPRPILINWAFFAIGSRKRAARVSSFGSRSRRAILSFPKVSQVRARIHMNDGGDNIKYFRDLAHVHG